MRRKSMGMALFVGLLLCVLVAMAIAAPDKYTTARP